MNFKTELPRQIGRRWLGMVLVIGFLTVILVQPALACPTCKQALAENGQSQDGLVRGYFWSILFMMSMPFLIFCGMGYYFGSYVFSGEGKYMGLALIIPVVFHGTYNFLCAFPNNYFLFVVFILLIFSILLHRNAKVRQRGKRTEREEKKV